MYLASYLLTISGPIVLVVYPGFTECFADGLEPEKAPVLAARLRPAAAAQFAEPSGPSAWKTIHSSALIGAAERTNRHCRGGGRAGACRHGLRVGEQFVLV